MLVCSWCANPAEDWALRVLTGVRTRRRRLAHAVAHTCGSRDSSGTLRRFQQTVQALRHVLGDNGCERSRGSQGTANVFQRAKKKSKIKVKQSMFFLFAKICPTLLRCKHTHT